MGSWLVATDEETKPQRLLGVLPKPVVSDAGQTFKDPSSGSISWPEGELRTNVKSHSVPWKLISSLFPPLPAPHWTSLFTLYLEAFCIKIYLCWFKFSHAASSSSCNFASSGDVWHRWNLQGFGRNRICCSEGCWEKVWRHLETGVSDINYFFCSWEYAEGKTLSALQFSLAVCAARLALRLPWKGRVGGRGRFFSSYFQNTFSSGWLNFFPLLLTGLSNPWVWVVKLNCCSNSLFLVHLRPVLREHLLFLTPPSSLIVVGLSEIEYLGSAGLLGRKCSLFQIGKATVFLDGLYGGRWNPFWAKIGTVGRLT